MNLYELLEIDENNFNMNILKKQYHKMCLKYHKLIKVVMDNILNLSKKHMKYYQMIINALCMIIIKIINALFVFFF